MIKELTEAPTWNVLDIKGEMYTVNTSYISPEGDTIIGLTKLDSGFYIEFNLIEFYRFFKYKL